MDRLLSVQVGDTFAYLLFVLRNCFLLVSVCLLPRQQPRVEVSGDWCEAKSSLKSVCGNVPGHLVIRVLRLIFPFSQSRPTHASEVYEVWVFESYSNSGRRNSTVGRSTTKVTLYLL